MNHGLIIGGVVDYHYVSVKRAPGAHKIATHLRRQGWDVEVLDFVQSWTCLLYTSPSPRDRQKSRMPSSA